MSRIFFFPVIKWIESTDTQAMMRETSKSKMKQGITCRTKNEETLERECHSECHRECHREWHRE